MPPMFGLMAEVRCTLLVALSRLMESDSVCRAIFQSGNLGIFCFKHCRLARLLSSCVYRHRQLKGLSTLHASVCCPRLIPRRSLAGNDHWECLQPGLGLGCWVSTRLFSHVGNRQPASRSQISKVDYIAACRQPAAARPSCLETRAGTGLRSQEPGDNSDITVPQPQDLWRRSWKDLLLHSERLSLHDVALRADVGVELEWQDATSRSIASCSCALCALFDPSAVGRTR